MSASLDDMPAYEHFQDELDLELKRYAKKYSLSNLHIENEFIQFICFTLFLTKPNELTNEILNYFFEENAGSEKTIKKFITFVNENDESYLKNMFSDKYQFYSKIDS